MLQEIMKHNPGLVHKKRETEFLLDQLIFFGLYLRDTKTGDFVFINVELYNSETTLVISHTYLDKDHNLSGIKEYTAMKTLSDVIADILLRNKYYLDVEAKDIDPFNFKLAQKEKELYLKEYIDLQYYYLVEIQPTSSKLKYENNELFFYNDLLKEYRPVPDCFLYELHLLIQKEAA